MNHLHMGWRAVGLLIAAAPLVYYVTATLAAFRFVHRESARKLPDYKPATSLLKPVHGVDFGSYENFSSFCRQDYPEYEILFAVNDGSDPAISLIHRLAKEFPERPIRLIVGTEQLGTNRKVNNLIALARAAKHEIVVLTDGDVRVGRHYLQEVVAPLSDGKAGAVTSFYRAITENNLAAELEAIGASSDFFAGVLVADWKEGMTFALGASIATTKSWLAKIGGLEAIANMHSDDYELGHRIAKAGGEVLLSREAVWTVYPAQTARGFWDHQVRWARTVRLCRPLSYLGLIFTHGLPWVLLAVAISPTKRIAAAYLLAYLVLRFAMAWSVGVRVVGDDLLRRKIWLVPMRDAIYFAVWVASLASNRITWRGQEFTMQKGQLVPVGSGEVSDARSVTRAAR
jgi:ceramide glucosyltransferase